MSVHTNEAWKNKTLQKEFMWYYTLCIYSKNLISPLFDNESFSIHSKVVSIMSMWDAGGHVTHNITILYININIPKYIYNVALQSMLGTCLG